MAVPQVVLWNSGDVLGGGDSATAGHDDSSYVTEVVLRANRPRAQARLIALREGPSGPEVVGFGVVQSGQPVATGKDRVKVEPLVRIAPLPVARILEHLAAEDARTDVELFTPPALRPRALSPKRGELVLAALTGLSREIAELLLRLQQEQQPIAGDRGQRIREERDAIDLALGMARMEATAEDLNDDVPATGPQEPLVGLLAPEALYDVEDDLISEDLRRFDQNGELTLTHASAARFVDNDFVLTIVNVNRKELEKVKGVDLIYYDVPGDCYTMVQYKRLTRRHAAGPGDERWAYTDRIELVKSLDRMDAGPGRMADASHFRLVTSPYWFKFVRSDAFTPADPVVLRGMYVPAEYLRLAIEDSSLITGPRHGFEVTYSNTRYLNRETFVGLVRKTMIGTTGRQTADVLAAVNKVATDRQAIFAVRNRRV